jgi:hypothetical protein
MSTKGFVLAIHHSKFPSKYPPRLVVKAPRISNVPFDGCGTWDAPKATGSTTKVDCTWTSPKSLNFTLKNSPLQNFENMENKEHAYL